VWWEADIDWRLPLIGCLSFGAGGRSALVNNRFVETYLFSVVLVTFGISIAHRAVCFLFGKGGR
jgi:hypothetical protein